MLIRWPRVFVLPAPLTMLQHHRHELARQVSLRAVHAEVLPASALQKSAAGCDTAKEVSGTADLVLMLLLRCCFQLPLEISMQASITAPAFFPYHRCFQAHPEISMQVSTPAPALFPAMVRVCL
jgi:hypothetical protein